MKKRLDSAAEHYLGFRRDRLYRGEGVRPSFLRRQESRSPSRYAATFRHP